MSQTILIADDDPVQRRLLEAMVRRFGYGTVVVENGDAALAALRSGEPIDLLILDLVMPGLDGFGVLSAMRDAKIEVPAVVQTAHGSIETVVNAMRAGATDFVVKPVGAERLQVSIKNALGGLPRRRGPAHAPASARDALLPRPRHQEGPDMAGLIRLADAAGPSPSTPS
jgi:DNA-binding NtrC family response regulator